MVTQLLFSDACCNGLCRRGCACRFDFRCFLVISVYLMQRLQYQLTSATHDHVCMCILQSLGYRHLFWHFIRPDFAKCSFCYLAPADLPATVFESSLHTVFRSGQAAGSYSWNKYYVQKAPIPINRSSKINRTYLNLQRWKVKSWRLAFSLS